MENNENPVNTSNMDPKVVSIVSYLTLIGWIVALVLNNPKSEQASFHIRQSLGIILVAIISGFIMIIPILGWLIGIAGYILAFVMWLLGFIGAVQGEQKVVPVLGERFQEWFKAL
jgi:uncharacterized membrane protein